MSNMTLVEFYFVSIGKNYSLTEHSHEGFFVIVLRQAKWSLYNPSNQQYQQFKAKAVLPLVGPILAKT